MCAGPSMNSTDALFARPTRPAAAPRVRSFAELVLNEIRTDVDGEAKLLTDKQAFSEFMDRVNESVLMGHRKPPSAASITKPPEETSEEDKEDFRYKPPKGNSDVMPASLSLQQPVDAGKTLPRMAANPLLRDSISRAVFPSPLRHRRGGGRAVSGDTSSSLPLTPPSGRAGPRKVRFHVGDEEVYPCSGEDKCLKNGHRQHDEQGTNAEEDRQTQSDRPEGVERRREESLGSEDFDGPTLLQDLRRWRREATAELVNGQDQPPPPPSRRTPTPSGRTVPPPRFRPPLTSTTGIGTNEAPGTLGPPRPPLLSSGHDQDNRTIGDRRSPCGRRPEADVGFAPGSKTAHVGGGPGTKSWIGWSGPKDGGTTDREWVRFQDERGALSSASTVAKGRNRMSAHDCNQQQRSDDLVAKASNGCRGQCFDSEEDERDARVVRSERLGGGPGCRGKESQEDVRGLSLDLSDCSDEKLGSLLERGRRRGSSGMAREHTRARVTPGGP